VNTSIFILLKGHLRKKKEPPLPYNGAIHRRITAPAVQGLRRSILNGRGNFVEGGNFRLDRANDRIPCDSNNLFFQELPKLPFVQKKWMHIL